MRKKSQVKNLIFHRGVRCGICYWALYDGDWCQNPNCIKYGRSVHENRIYLTNDEAQVLILEKSKYLLNKMK